MAIRKISRIQHRRGLKSDLPPKLNEGELGWCLDTKELFIGNSDADQGNSQVLTQWTPNDKVILHSYQGSTGIPATSVPRPIGAILDDFVSVKDYGAIGNGLADDSAAIQSAIHDRYGKAVSQYASPLSGFVTIFLPAGTYRITKPIALYPYMRLQGEGINRTKIVLDNELETCVIETADNHGNTDINIGMDAAVLPNKIEIIDIWVEQPNLEGDVVVINRAAGVKLENLKLTGAIPAGSDVHVQSKGIVCQTLGDIFVPKDITVTSCEIYGVGHAIYVDEPVKNIKINSSDFHDCWHGISLGVGAVNGGPKFVKATNNHFYEIESYGIGCFGSNPGIISTGNSFFNVGVKGDTVPIIFGPLSSACSSIGDQFSPVGNVVVSNSHPSENIVVGPQYSGLHSRTPQRLGPVSIYDDNGIVPLETGITYDPALFNTIFLDYTLSRGTDKRVGRLTILTNGTINTTVLQDEFTTLGSDLGVTFGFTFVSGHISLTYLTTTLGVDGTMKYVETKWLT
jgi:hypothetical protein